MTRRPEVGDRLLVGLGARRPEVGTAVEVYQDYCVIQVGDRRENFWFWDEIRWRIGPVAAWSVYEDWCEEIGPLDRLAQET